MLAFKLNNQNIDSAKLLHQIQHMINKFSQSNPGVECLLVIDIKTVTSDDSSFIPKLEYKPS